MTGRFCFIPRATYGDYVSDLARGVLASGAARHLRDACVDLTEAPDAVTLHLSSGRTIETDRVVLATGHDAKPSLEGIPAEQPWTEGSLDRLASDAPILIIGSGLTMVDMTLSLDRRGYQGPITVVSRRRLLSSAHRPVMQRYLAEQEVPFGALRRRRAAAAYAAPVAFHDARAEAPLLSTWARLLGHPPPSDGARSRTAYGGVAFERSSETHRGPRSGRRTAGRRHSCVHPSARVWSGRRSS